MPAGLGLKILLKNLRQKFPKLKFGYFNPYLPSQVKNIQKQKKQNNLLKLEGVVKLGGDAVEDTEKYRVI